ncbi:hypothetical protein ACQV4C_31070 [Streptomyces albidoflavus]|uniref:hypothetical protein n=1 Tax=Streptomyces albidoflavus TaxID=1886 RepID=UPI003D164E00
MTQDDGLQHENPSSGWVPVIRRPRRSDVLASIGIGVGGWRLASEALPPEPAAAIAVAFALLVPFVHFVRLPRLYR